ncbi:unnamed protein product [Closterium sp. Yama58-4]|nr:unnamed protein product [Closterium sp. Yama58-4]
MALCLRGGVSAVTVSVNLVKYEPANRPFPSRLQLHSSQICKPYLTNPLKSRLTNQATGQRTSSWVRNSFMSENGGGEWDEEDEEEFEEDDEEEHWEEEEAEEEERVETVQVQARLYEDSSGYSEGDEHQAEEEKKQENQQQQQQPLQWLAEGAAAALKGAVEGGALAAAVGALLEASQPAEEHSESDAREKGEEYSATMQMAMGNTALVYRHELGMNYARVLPNLLVGSCLQSPLDLDHLRDVEGVGAVQCLQRDSDLEYFDLDINPIIERAAERGDIRHLWTEIRDFDPFDLRMQLPRAVAALHKAVMECGTAYVHCTAGLGRAPAVALAYMWWMRDLQLEEANEILQKVRPCGPKLFAIRAAACDLLTGNPLEPVEINWRNRGVNETVEVAGLDVGWHHRLPLTREPASNTWTLTRELPIGTYYYKHIVNGTHWSYNPDAPLTPPDRDYNVNNYIEVVGSSLDPAARDLRKRIMQEGAPLTQEDRAAVVAKIIEIAGTL